VVSVVGARILMLEHRWCPRAFAGLASMLIDDLVTSGPLGCLVVMSGPMFPVLESLAVTDVTPVAALRQFMTKVASKPDDTRSLHPHLVQCILPVELTSPWALRYRVVRNPFPLLLLRCWIFA
jgi:hypothetical protein